METDSVDSKSESSSWGSRLGMFKNFSEDDYNIMKAAHQYMVYAYNEVDMKIDESVYQDKSIDANKSESKSERENLEEITLEQKARLQKVLKRDNLEDYGKLVAVSNTKCKSPESSERREADSSPEMINAIQTLGVNNDVSKFIVDGLRKIPDSLKMGAFVAASVGMMSRSMMGSLCIMGASAYAWDRWIKGHKENHYLDKGRLDMELDVLAGKKERHKRECEMSSKNDLSNEQNDPDNFLLRKYFESNPQVCLLEDDIKLGKNDKISNYSTSTGRDPVEISVHAYATHMKMPQPPPSVAPSESDLEIPVTMQRVFFKVRFNSNMADHKCLFDPGATSSVISKHSLELEERLCGRKFPRLPREAMVKAFGDDVAKMKMEIVLVNIYVDGKLRSRYAPMLVQNNVEINSQPYDAIIGINLLDGWGVVWEMQDGKTNLTFKKDFATGLNIKTIRQKHELPPPPLDHTETKMRVVKGVTVESMQTVKIPVKLDQHFNKDHGNLVEVRPEICDLEMSSTASIMEFQENQKQFMLRVTNDSDQPIYLTKDLEVGEVKVYNDGIFDMKSEPEINSALVDLEYKYKVSEVSCSCNIKTDRDAHLIIFHNEYGENAHCKQVINGIHPLEKWRQAPRLMYDDDHIFQVLKERDGTYHFDIRMIKPKLKERARVLMSFREELDTEMRKYLEKFRQFVPDIEICFLRNTGCRNCGSIANRDDERLFSNINGVKIYAIGHRQQPYSLWRVADKDSPVAHFRLGDYVNMQVFKSNFKLFIYLHMTKWHDQQKYRWESVMHLLMTQLRILQVPPALSILTTYDDMACKEVKQMMRALFMTKVWEGLPMYEPKVGKDSGIKVVNFMLDHCSCDACDAIRNFKPCPADYFRMLFQGNLGDPKGIAKNTRAHVEDVGPIISEIGELMAYILSASEEVQSLPDFGEKQKVFPGEVEDVKSEDSFENEQNFVGTVPDGDEILHNYHKNVDWRTIIKEESLPEFPGKPEIRKMLIEILDRRTNVFAANEYEWRWLNVPPVILHWINEKESVVDKPTNFNPARGSQLVDKVLRLLELAMIKIVPRSDGSWIQNVCNSYVVPHSSQTKRDMMTGKVGSTELTEKSHKASTMRLILDLRNANRVLKNPKQNDYVLDSVDTVMSRIAEAKSLSKLDLTKAYRGLPVDESSMRSLCFRANYGMLKPFLFSFVSLPEGLSICPAIYQTKIEEALMTELDHAIVYIDDIIIFHNSSKENLETVDRVLGKLQEVNALVGLNKCQFDFEKGEFLGFHIEVTENGVIYGIPQSKLDVFKNMNCPTNRKQLLTYYGMLMFLYKNIPGLQAHVEPLTRHLPTKIPRPFTMTDIQKRAFEKLNKTLDKLPLLHLFSYERTAYLFCDASLTHAGSCLAQLNDDGSLRLCMFYSKKFDAPTIYNATSIDKEIAAVMDSVRHFKRYLVRCVKTVIITDLAAMVSMLSSQMEFQNTKIGRHSFKLFSLDLCFQLRHVSSKFGVLQDTLSRIYEQPVTETGLPVAHKADMHEFLEKYKNTIPQEWKEGAIFTYQDMIDHLTEVVMNDPTISKTLKSKRLNGLLEQLQPQYMPESIKFAKEKIDSPVYKSHKVSDVLTPSEPEIKAFIAEYRQESIKVPAKFCNVQTEGYAPPRKIKTLSIAQIIKLQDDDLQCRKAKMYILTTPEHKQDGRIRNRFRVLNGNLLVTRRKHKLPWSEVENLRVYLPPVAALTVITTLHLIYGHPGKNHLEYYFSASFKCSSRRELVYAVIEGCNPCRLYKWNALKQAPPGRFSIPEGPAERYHADIVELPAGPINNTTYKYFLGIIDAYSSLFLIYPIRNQTSRVILTAFEHIFSLYPPPRVLCLDNAKYFRTDDFARGLKNLGVDHIHFSTPNKSTTNSPIENRFSTLRKLAQLNHESFGSKSISQVVFASATQMNVRPLYRLRQHTKDNLPPSAMDLFFGLDPMRWRCPVAEYMKELEPKKHHELRRSQEKLLREYDRERALEHEASIKDIRLAEEKIKVGSLVLATNWKRKKHLEKGTNAFKKELYVVVAIIGQRVTLRPMFSQTKHTFVTNVNDVKLIKGYKMLNMLPPHLQKFLGHDDLDNINERKNRPSFFVNNRPRHSDRVLRSGKGARSDLAEPALGDEQVFSDSDDDNDEEDIDWMLFFSQEVDPNLKFSQNPPGVSQSPGNPNSQGIYKAPETMFPATNQIPKNPPPKQPFQNRNFTEGLNSTNMPPELEPHKETEGSPATRFAKNVAGGRINLDKLGNNQFRPIRPDFTGPPRFGENPKFSPHLRPSQPGAIRFQPQSQMRVFTPPKNNWFSYFTNQKDKNDDQIVQTNFKDGVAQNFGNQPGVTSTPVAGTTNQVPKVDEPPIGYVGARPKERGDKNDSSLYEDAKSILESPPMQSPSRNRSAGAIAPNEISIDFDRLKLDDSPRDSFAGNSTQNMTTDPLQITQNIANNVTPDPLQITQDLSLRLPDTSIVDTPPRQQLLAQEFLDDLRPRPVANRTVLRQPNRDNLGASPQLTEQNRDVLRTSDRIITPVDRLNYDILGGTNEKMKF